MPLETIDPLSAKSMRSQSKDSKQPVLGGLGFSDYLSSTAAGASNAVAYQAGYQPAAVTQAAITGIVGGSNNITQNGSNAPYFGGASLTTASTPFASGGYSTAGLPYGGYGAGAGASVGAGGYPTLGGGTGPSQDYVEKQALFQQMNDANWELLVTQITVNDLNRDWQARSNILKSKSDTELNAVRNLKA